MPDPGAHVERGLHRPPHGEVRERERRRVHPGDMVGRLARPAPAAGRRRPGSRRGGRSGRARAHPPPASTRPSARGARATAARAPARPRRRVPAVRARTDARRAPSGSTPASLRSCTTRSAYRASSSPLMPSASRRPSPLRPGAENAAELRDRAAVSEPQRPAVCPGRLGAHNGRLRPVQCKRPRARLRLGQPVAAGRAPDATKGGTTCRRLQASHRVVACWDGACSSRPGS